MTRPANQSIRVLCVDDHRLVREGLKELLEKQPDIQVVAAAATGRDAVALFDTFRPDVTLMDLRMPDISGLDAIRLIRRTHPQARIVVLTMYHGDEDITQALQAGATTYVTKDMVINDLIDVIREVHAGGQPMNAEIRAILRRRAELPILTTREIDVLALIAEGHRNKEIARRLAIAEDTVHAHLKNIYSKLGVSDRTAAVNIGLRRGIIHIGPE
jgi:DNA-binding NarL/FixJ family response regulator